MKQRIWIIASVLFLALAGYFASLKPKFSFHAEDFGVTIITKENYDHWSVSICDAHGYVTSSESKDGWKLYPVSSTETIEGTTWRQGYRWPKFRHTYLRSNPTVAYRDFTNSVLSTTVIHRE